MFLKQIFDDLNKRGKKQPELDSGWEMLKQVQHDANMSIKRIKRIITFMLVITSVLFYSCAGNAQKGLSSDDTKEAIHHATAFFMLPDSLRSVEEQELFGKLETALYDGCTLNNGKFEIIISKEEWEKRGIPEIYYTILKRDIENNNNYLDTVSAPLRELFMESWRVSREEYFTREKSHNK